MPRGSNSQEKQKLAVERWFVIWDILFPGVDRPANPCKSSKSKYFHRKLIYDHVGFDGANHSTISLSQDINTFLAILNKFLEVDYKEGRLERSIETHQVYVNAIRLTLAEMSANRSSLRTTRLENMHFGQNTGEEHSMTAIGLSMQLAGEA
jgi:hypothetical protein